MKFMTTRDTPCLSNFYILKAYGALFQIALPCADDKSIPLHHVPRLFEPVVLVFHFFPRLGHKISVRLNSLIHPRAIGQSASKSLHFVGANRARYFGSKSPRSESKLGYNKLPKSFASVILAFSLDIEAMSCHAPFWAITAPSYFFDGCRLGHINECKRSSLE